MHMADALLSPAVGASFWAGTLAAIAYCSRKLKEYIDDRLIPLMGVLGAFIFAAQMVNFTIPGTGSSGHLGGGILLAILLGPYAGFIVMASVLFIQALFFADGGLLALGCNIWNLGIYPCFIAYPLIYRPLISTGNSRKMISIAAVLSGIAGLQLGAFSVVIQTILSGRSELTFGTFVLVMQPIHLAIGIVEGIVTAGVINFIRTVQPELLSNSSLTAHLPEGISVKKVFAGLLISAMIIGGAISWIASANPDGLEWSIRKITGSTELHAKGAVIDRSLRSMQEKTSFLPDYNFRKKDESSNEKEKTVQPVIDAGKSISGIVGSILVLAVVILAGIIIRQFRKRSISRNSYIERPHV